MVPLLSEIDSFTQGLLTAENVMKSLFCASLKDGAWSMFALTKFAASLPPPLSFDLKRLEQCSLYHFFLEC